MHDQTQRQESPKPTYFHRAATIAEKLCGKRRSILRFGVIQRTKTAHHFDIALGRLRGHDCVVEILLVNLAKKKQTVTKPEMNVRQRGFYPRPPAFSSRRHIENMNVLPFLQTKQRRLDKIDILKKY